MNRVPVRAVAVSLLALAIGVGPSESEAPTGLLSSQVFQQEALAPRADAADFRPDALTRTESRFARRRPVARFVRARPWRRPALAALSLALGLTHHLPAQTEWTVGAAGATSSPHLITSTPGRGFAMVNARFSVPLLKTTHGRLDYVAELQPLILMVEPREAGFFYTPQNGLYRRIDQGPATLVAAGAMPIGLRWVFRPSARWAPYVSAAGGFLYSDRPIPYQIQDGTQFNFTFQFGAGMRWSKLYLEYNWFHTSNAGRSAINPGIDANMIGVGLRFDGHGWIFRRPRRAPSSPKRLTSQA